MFNSLDVLDDLVPVSELSNGRTEEDIAGTPTPEMA